ncbi:hypothetical protein DV738_g215, partial [Chaetothyriales sp. CBS 135597]
MSSELNEDGGTSTTGHHLSAETEAHFQQLRDRLAPYFLDNAPPVSTMIQAPLTVPEIASLPFPYECAFGWEGDVPVPELEEEIPESKDEFVAKVHEAKNQCDLVQRTLSEYQNTINMHKDHSFGLDFLKQQNEAAAITHYQLNQTRQTFDEVLAHVNVVDDDDQDGQEYLFDLYEEAFSWILRTKQVLNDCHVWIKLNYTLTAAKATPEEEKTSA